MQDPFICKVWISGFPNSVGSCFTSNLVPQIFVPPISSYDVKLAMTVRLQEETINIKEILYIIRTVYYKSTTPFAAHYAV